MSPGAAAGAATGAALLGIAIGALVAGANDPNQSPPTDASLPGGTWGAHTNVRQDLPPGNMIAGGGPEAMAQAAATSSPTTFNHTAVQAAIKDGINGVKGHTTIYECVPNGESCNEASDRRGAGIASQLQARQGQLGLQDYEITVGNTAGVRLNPYDTTGNSSQHTWNTINFKNKKTGQTVTYEADDYLGWQSVKKIDTPPTWSTLDKATNQYKLRTIPPKSSDPASATTSPPAGSRVK